MMRFKFSTGKFRYWPFINAFLWVLIILPLITGGYELIINQRSLDWHKQVDFFMLNGLLDAVGFFLVWLILKWLAEKLDHKLIEFTVKPMEEGGND